MPSTTVTYRVVSENVAELLKHLCQAHINFQVRWEARFRSASGEVMDGSGGVVSDDFSTKVTHWETGWTGIAALVTVPLKYRILLSQFGEPLT